MGHSTSRSQPHCIAAPSPGQTTETTIEQMPAKLETQFALSAAPPALRDRATFISLTPGRDITCLDRERAA